MAEPIAPGVVIDGYRVGERIHVGAQSQIFRVSGPVRDFPMIMKVPRIGPLEPSENLISFETETVILPTLTRDVCHMKKLASLLLILLPAGSLAAESPPNPGTALITGSDRGIDFALVQEFENRGWEVIATARDPAKATELNAFAKAHPRVTVEKLDVTDTAGIDALASKLKNRPIDALLNNAGIAGTFEGQQTAKLDQDEFVRVLRVNSYGPLRVSAAFLDHVAASRQRKRIPSPPTWNSGSTQRNREARSTCNA